MIDADVRQLRLVAERTAVRLAAEARRASPPRGLARLVRGWRRLRQGFARRLKRLVREHWDLAAFDVVFGSVKAFGVYPALYFAGLVWTIPLMESIVLNTQLWTGGYLVVRGRIRSEWGRRRYGHPLVELDALCDRLLRITPGDARHVHRFTLNGESRVLRVRHSRVRAWLAAWRGEPEEGVLLQSRLRAWVEPELRFRASPLRANPFLYESVLLAHLLATPEAHPRLLAASVPDVPAGGEERALRAALGEAPTAPLARVNQQADALAAALHLRLGRGASTRCLRALHAGLGRIVRKRLAELEDLRYRVLADRAEGRALRESPSWRALCRKRAEARAALARAGAFAQRAARVPSQAAAERLAREALHEAGTRGHALRRARAAAWLAGITDLSGAWAPRASELRA